MNKRIKTFRKPYRSLVVCLFCQKEGIERGAQYWTQHLGSKNKYYHCQKHRKEARELARSSSR